MPMTDEHTFQQEPLNIMEGYGFTANRNLRPTPTTRLLIGTPTRGTIRMEWALARFGLVIPCNWAHGQSVPFISSNMPIGYSTADAQNIIVKDLVEQEYEWLLLIEDDTCPPPDALQTVNERMRKGTVPVVSGLYYQKGMPPEPLIYRGSGTSYYDDFVLGDHVWCDGIPTGFFLCHSKVLRIMWDESPEYMAGNVKTRRVFEQPSRVWFDEEAGAMRGESGTSDLAWCKRVRDEDVLRRAGWPKIAKRKYPFLVDTNILCRHISPDGTMYPPQDHLPNARRKPSR